LEALKVMRISCKRHVRWSEFLSRFDFSLVYARGSENHFADFLSCPEAVLKGQVFSSNFMPPHSFAASATLSVISSSPFTRLD
jgi:hypothetical protein